MINLFEGEFFWKILSNDKQEYGNIFKKYMLISIRRVKKILCQKLEMGRVQFQNFSGFGKLNFDHDFSSNHDQTLTYQS